MNRITVKNLRGVCVTLNHVTHSPPEPWIVAPDGRHVGQIGCYHIDCAYGGFELQRIYSTGGATTSPIGGHRPARQTYDLIHAYMAGILDAQTAAEQAHLARLPANLRGGDTP